MDINDKYMIYCDEFKIDSVTDGFLWDKIFGYCLDFNLLFYYCYYRECFQSDFLFLSSSLKVCSYFVGYSDDVEIQF